MDLPGALAEMKSHVLPKDYHELDNKEVDIYLIQSGPRLLPGMSEKSSKAAEKYLKDLGVQIMLDTRVTGYDGEYVTTRDGHKILTERYSFVSLTLDLNFNESLESMLQL